ncbi:ATP-binding protein [Terribacillus sp. 179-K 1B1 HS]|uniref:ATP-binding protein n=1 Tax=Terribacillus sp. 179-K 1B1 HS TaxID=3142388 RepID=UPI0039A2F68D
MQSKASSSQNSNKFSEEHECSECGDTGSILVKETLPVGHQDNPYQKEITRDYWRRCSCVEQRSLQNRLQNALIPDEFKEARFDNYIKESDVQNTLYNAIIDYLREFKQLLLDKPAANSIGFIATFGEARIRELDPSERYLAKNDHNNFGLGKTHLQMAAAKWILKNVKISDELEMNKTLNKRIKKKFMPERSAVERGCRVLCISDVEFMDELMNAKRLNDGGEQFNNLKRSVMDADVLVWDDLGKTNYSRAKEDAYYAIINERYRHKRPIIFSSNEDEGTITDKIGYAATSRLLSMCGDRLYSVEGPDYRLKR